MCGHFSGSSVSHRARHGMRRKRTFDSDIQGMLMIECGSSCRAKPLVCRPISNQARSAGTPSSLILVGQEGDDRKLFHCMRECLYREYFTCRASVSCMCGRRMHLLFLFPSIFRSGPASSFFFPSTPRGRPWTSQTVSIGGCLGLLRPTAPPWCGGEV